MPAICPITVIRGATKPDIVWRLMSAGQPFDGTGSEFVLTIRSVGSGSVHSLRFSTATPSSGLTYDRQTGRLRWHRTAKDSRAIQAGSSGEYEIERRIGGDQSIIVGGPVIGKGGLSDD